MQTEDAFLILTLAKGSTLVRAGLLGEEFFARDTASRPSGDENNRLGLEDHQVSIYQP